MNKDSKIVVFGAGGLIGGEIVSQLIRNGYEDVVACNHKMLDITNQSAVNSYMSQIKPQYVFFCAVRAITDFENGEVVDAVEAYSNIMMQLNVMEACRVCNVKKAVFLGSAMLYPWDMNHQNEPLSEELLENFDINKYRPSMRSTVLSKYVGMKMCQYYNSQYGTSFIYAVPTHIYGGFKNRKNLYFLERIVSDICDAKLNGIDEIYLDVFGEGKALKQFLHVSDCADAIITIMNCYEDIMSPINIASDEPESWSTIVKMICEITGYNGIIKFNSERQENMANRLCSTTKLNKLQRGGVTKISMKKGLEQLINEYIETKGDKKNSEK